jgi:ArsR family transcriptional regulator
LLPGLVRRKDSTVARRARSAESTRTTSTDCASRLRVLADGTRLEVLRQLLKSPKHVGELNESIDVPQNLLSHHLRVLRDEGLVEARRDGRAVLYRLAPDLRSVARGKEISLGCCRLSFE